ncbi:MAG: hypothetical protein ACREMY_18370 [bacterium]
MELPRLEGIRERTVATGNAGRRCFAGNLFHPKVHERFPERCPAHGKAEKSGTRDAVVTIHLLFSRPAPPTEDDAAHFISAVTTSSSHDMRAAFTAIESFDLPDIPFYAGVLQFLNCSGHQVWPQLRVAGLPVIFETARSDVFEVSPFGAKAECRYPLK